MEDSDKEVLITFHLLELWADGVDLMDNVLHSMDAVPCAASSLKCLTSWTNANTT